MQNRTYRNSWDRESIVEHTLRHNSTECQQRFRGIIDFTSPSRRLIQKELCDHARSEEIQEDAASCANILKLIISAQRISSPEGIVRANCCAGLRVYSAIRYHIDGKTYETIGYEMGGRARQIPERYASRFLEWSAEHCDDLIDAVTPDCVIGHCLRLVSPGQSLGDVLDELRISLVELMHELKTEALNKGLGGVEVYSDITQFSSATGIFELLKA